MREQEVLMEGAKHYLMKFHLQVWAGHLNAVHFSAVNGWRPRDGSLAVGYSRERLKDAEKKEGVSRLGAKVNNVKTSIIHIYKQTINTKPLWNEKCPNSSFHLMSVTRTFQLSVIYGLIKLQATVILARIYWVLMQFFHWGKEIALTCRRDFY